MIPQIDTSGWPAWAQAAEPQILKWLLVLGATILIWIAAIAVKRLVMLIGRLATPKDQSFEGSSWDLGASVARLFALILMSPLPLGLAWTGRGCRRGHPYRRHPVCKLGRPLDAQLWGQGPSPLGC